MKPLFMRWRTQLLILAFLCVIPSFSFAKTIYETSDPFGGMIGIWGQSIFKNQSAAIRFTPQEDVTLDKLSLWLYTTDFSGTTYATAIISVMNDEVTENGSMPGKDVLDVMLLRNIGKPQDPQNPPAPGVPYEESVSSVLKPTLKAGTNYWIVVSSNEELENTHPVWAYSGQSEGYTTFMQNGEWVPVKETVNALTMRIEANPVASVK